MNVFRLGFFPHQNHFLAGAAEFFGAVGIKHGNAGGRAG